ncbi:hypothetical protein ACQQ2N_19805 [Dokdonella sp. MW10]|uniref:hypothetical protein n=1 Tax=Dokdonella sp. MW10 TaxID=2992926 RepID=UPI003F7CDFDF
MRRVSFFRGRRQHRFTGDIPPEPFDFSSVAVIPIITSRAMSIRERIETAIAWIVCAFCALVFGMIVGHVILECLGLAPNVHYDGVWMSAGKPGT